MRDKFSCFSENSVSFLQPSSSSSSSSASASLLPSIQNAVTSVYRTRPPSTQKALFITLSWSRSLILGQSSLTIIFGPGPDPNPASPSSSSFKLITSSSRLFKKNKGSRRIEMENSHIEVFWDFSNVRFDHGPEPLGGFYVVVIVDWELGLFLGDMDDEAVEKKFKCSNQRPSQSSLVSRREHFSGSALYRTRCQFGGTGPVHDIVIRISGEAENLNRESVLSVYIDKKKVMRVKRLQWNFRGSQTIFIEETALTIDMLWDVHDWFFSQACEGRGVFMFTPRRALLDGRSRPDDEKLVEKLETDQRADDFSLLIYATRSSWK